MEYFDDLISDPSLAPHSHWHAVQKWLVDGEIRKQLWDEPWTADEWSENEVRVTRNLIDNTCLIILLGSTTQE
jgi:hypothetical protein